MSNNTNIHFKILTIEVIETTNNISVLLTINDRR